MLWGGGLRLGQGGGGERRGFRVVEGRCYRCLDVELCAEDGCIYDHKGRLIQRLDSQFQLPTTSMHL